MDEHNDTKPTVEPVEPVAEASSNGDGSAHPPTEWIVIDEIERLKDKIRILENRAKQQAYISAINTIGILLVGVVAVKASRELSIAP